MKDRTPIHSPRRLVTAVAAAAIAATGTARVAADDEWWDNTPYYEEDSWLDITEWFDGNDYNPTDETAFRWDNETYEASNDTGTDNDNDWDWDYDYGNAYAYGNDYDSAASSFVHEPWFGYDDRYADNWFYDYWDDGYAFYEDWDNDGFYDYASSWYDFDGDGYYDAYYISYDWDDNGFYEDVNFYTINNVSDSDRKKAGQNQAKNSAMQEVDGEVTKTKNVSVRDTKHLVALIEKPDGTTCLVDLGPASAVNQLNLDEGSELQARGPEIKAGDKLVILAQTADSDGHHIEIERSQKSLRGQVADTRKMTVDGTSHLMAIVATGKENKTLVDLGPAKKLDRKIKKDDRIEVTGVPAKVGDRKVLMATELSIDGKDVQIARSGKSNRQKGAMASNKKKSDRPIRGSISGEVTETRTITVRGNKRKTAVLETNDGNRNILVDLGSADSQTLKVREGDHLKASGAFVRAKDGRAVLVAREASVKGNSMTMTPTDRSQKSVTGEIVATRKAQVRNGSRQLAKLETDDGKTVIVDLGDSKNLKTDLQKGDELTARGVAVKTGRNGQLIIMAREIEHNGSAKTKIRRPSAGKNPKSSTKTTDATSR